MVQIQLNLPVGASEHCLELPGVYTLQPMGDFRFDRQYTFATAAPTPLSLVATAVRLTGSVELPPGAAVSTANVTVTAVVQVCVSSCSSSESRCFGRSVHAPLSSWSRHGSGGDYRVWTGVCCRL